MSNISNRRLARGFVQQLSKSDSPKKLINQLAAVIVESKQVSSIDLLLDDINLEFEKQFSTSNATVYSAHELNTALKAEVAKIVKSASGTDKVIINEEIDTSLLGGVKIETPEREIDLSLKNKLRTIGGTK